MDKPVTLTALEIQLNVSTSTPLYFDAYYSPTKTGTFVKAYEKSLALSGTGLKWYSSGPVSWQLSPGYYLLVTRWSGTASYAVGNQTVPLPASFGALEAAITSSPVNSTPPATWALSSTGKKPVFQRITTQ